METLYIIKGTSVQKSHIYNDQTILCTLCTSVGAADKAAIQLVEVQPYQLPVSDA
jgi:hypothetical protein